MESKAKNMTVIKIMAGIGVVALAGFFWNDISNAGSSVLPSGKKEKVQLVTEQADDAAGYVEIKDKWDMPAVLKEISGVSHIDGDRFACVQDELGKIFIYNTARSAVEKEVPFGDPGDYEGLAVVGKDAWVLRADGKLFQVADFETKPSVKRFDTPLTTEQNPEGLCYDKNNNRLLIAIKDEEPGDPGYKGIYAFDLSSKKLAAEPVFKLNTRAESSAKSSEGKKKKGNVIKPSAISIHPSTGEIYITDGPKSKLLVLSKAGAVQDLYELNGKEFTQPEGITFNPSGEMFISNEGSKNSGNIIKAEIRKK